MDIYDYSVLPIFYTVLKRVKRLPLDQCIAHCNHLIPVMTLFLISKVWLKLNRVLRFIRVPRWLTIVSFVIIFILIIFILHKIVLRYFVAFIVNTLFLFHYHFIILYIVLSSPILLFSSVRVYDSPRSFVGFFWFFELEATPQAFGFNWGSLWIIEPQW